MLIIAVALTAVGTVALAWPNSGATDEPAPGTTRALPTAGTETLPPDRLADEICDSVPREVLVRTVNGTHPTRSGQACR